MTDGYGTFGNLSETYDKVRPEMPTEVLDYLFTYMQPEHPHMLDVGCGTGIVTRQLSKYGAVTGTDIDERMIGRAKLHDDGITYITAPTEVLPFEDSTFDIVTAFSSFHWFANMEALSEMRRVLKEDGILFIANRNQTGDIKREYTEILKTFTSGQLPNIKKNYDPVQLIQEKFKSVVEKEFQTIEQLSVEKTLKYVQSTSPWNLVPDEKKEDALEALRTYFETQLRDGFVNRPIEIHTTLTHTL